MVSTAPGTVADESAARALDALEKLPGPDAVQRSAEAIAEFLDPYGRRGQPGGEPVDSLGVGEYRSHPDFADDVTAGYSFNGGAINQLLRSLKQALDPQAILSPARQGI